MEPTGTARSLASERELRYCASRLNLRPPLREALKRGAEICAQLDLPTKPPARDGKHDNEHKRYLDRQLKAVQTIAPKCTAFDRNFPSLCFSIATGIGKTRLMAALMLYLHRAYHIRHFFVLAPNLTLYNKLRQDFGNPAYEKCVFRGTEYLNSLPPRVIDAERYQEAAAMTDSLMREPFEINIFNISKFNRDSSKNGTDVPRLRKLSETLGQSYYDYLSRLPDLVLFMDEAHRYHATAARKALDELRPVLGLEMTATPNDEKGRPFRNIVFEYNLAEALADGKYVKIPQIATRRNFEARSCGEEERKLVMLDDALSCHEETKRAIALYASAHPGARVVHPFILVVCKDTHEAAEVENLFAHKVRHGEYADRLLRIDSKTKGDEEVEAKFVALERPENRVEVVIHVNMLKEGWDVNNLYTIVPLRKADAVTLIEQTIGRGLRLPYGGARTGDREVDTLTIMAHENFERVLRAAQDPNSVLHRVEFATRDLDTEPVEPAQIEAVQTSSAAAVVAAVSVSSQGSVSAPSLSTAEREAVAQAVAPKVVSAINTVALKLGSRLTSYSALSTPAAVEQVTAVARRLIAADAAVSGSLFREDEAAAQQSLLRSVVKAVVVDYQRLAIPIPRVVVQTLRSQALIEAFHLDTSEGFDHDSASPEILQQRLDNMEVNILAGRPLEEEQSAEDMLINVLLEKNDIVYEANSEQLYRLSGQAVEALRSHCADKSEAHLRQVVKAHCRGLAERMYRQIIQHMRIVPTDYSVPTIQPFTRLETPPDIAVYSAYGKLPATKSVSPRSLVPKYVFEGFLKSYYRQYRFDSATELDFSYVLEHSSEVLRWLRPVPRQFNIYYDSNSHRYEPDFVVETASVIYLCETKARKDVALPEVQSKASAAWAFCDAVSQQLTVNGGKAWRYALFPDDTVVRQDSFTHLLEGALTMRP